MEILIYLIPNVLRVYAIYILIGVFLQKKEKHNLIYFISFAVFYCINSFLYLWLNTIIVNVASNIIPIFLITFLYESKYWSKIFTTFIVYAATMFWEIVVVMSIANFFVKEETVLISEFIEPILLFITALFLRTFIKQRFQVPSSIKAIYYFVLIFIPAGSIAIGCLVINFENGSIIKPLIISVILLTLNFFVFYLFDQIIISYKNQNELELQKKQNEILKLQEQYSRQYVKNADLQYDSIRKIRHDMKDQLSVVYAMLSEGRTDDAMDYISKNADIISSNYNIVNTDSIIVNAVVNSKFTVAETVGIKVQCSTVKRFDGIDETDLCNILSNMLDNAITACMKIPEDKERFVTLDISCENNIYRFVVKNSINGSVLKNNKRLLTSKSDKKNHGFGVKIIREIAGKYRGRCDFFEQENVFCCMVSLMTE